MNDAQLRAKIVSLIPPTERKDIRKQIKRACFGNTATHTKINKLQQLKAMCRAVAALDEIMLLIEHANETGEFTATQQRRR